MQLRTARTSKSAQQPPAKPADYATLQAKFKEIQTLMNLFNNSNVQYILPTEIKQELQSTKVSVFLTHHAPALCDHTLSP